MAALGMQLGETRNLAFAATANHRLKLLEVDEEMIELFQLGT